MGVKELSHGALGRPSRTKQASQEFTFYNLHPTKAGSRGRSVVS